MNVLLALRSSEENGDRGRLEGLSRHAATSSWDLRRMEFMMAMLRSYCSRNDPIDTEIWKYRHTNILRLSDRLAVAGLFFETGV